MSPKSHTFTGLAKTTSVSDDERILLHNIQKSSAVLAELAGLQSCDARISRIMELAREWALDVDEFSIQDMVSKYECGELSDTDLEQVVGGKNIEHGGDGSETLWGARNIQNQLYGGGGNDTLFGENLNDTLEGGDGNDSIYAGAGDDSLDGGDGNDYARGELGNDFLKGGEGNDSLYGDDGNDVMYGDGGNDFVYGGSGNDQLHGGQGNDVLEGGFGNDTIYGDQGNDVLRGNSGDDILHGGDGDDSLWGGRGNDILEGGDGNDTLQGGYGNDVLTGGDGDNVYIFRNWEGGRDTITDFNEGDRILLSGVFDRDSRTSILNSSMIHYDGNNTVISYDKVTITVENAHITLEALREMNGL